jgi:hypothetical protein
VTGYIEDFEVALSGTVRCVATDTPLNVPDNNLTGVTSVVDCASQETSLPSATPTPTSTATPTPTPTPVVLDTDADGVPDATDNCPGIANASQINTDAAPIVTSGIVPVDNTVVNSDGLGDECDEDDDNDGLPDASEPAGCSGSGPLNAVVNDTDGDRVLDGAECVLGSNPSDAGSRPSVPFADDADHDGLSNTFEGTIGTNPNDADSDDDKLLDGIEYKGYASSPLVVNSDNEGCRDGIEAASVDVNTVVNSADLGIIATVFGQADKPNMDIDKNRQVNAADLGIVATLFGAPC